jgi:hypothetical protein
MKQDKNKESTPDANRNKGKAIQVVSGSRSGQPELAEKLTRRNRNEL